RSVGSLSYCAEAMVRHSRRLEFTTGAKPSNLAGIGHTTIRGHSLAAPCSVDAHPRPLLWESIRLLLSDRERPYRIRTMPNDGELLREFVEGGSEEAFRILVERHTGMVHGAALRVVHDESVAEEVTQAVFIILARKARSLTHKPVLAGWLYRTAHFVALEALRTEKRRRHDTQQFADQKDSP